MKISKRLHEEGTKAILTTLVIVVALGVLTNWLWPSQTVWHYLLYAFLLIVLVLTIRFFRVPIWRKTTIEEDAVLAPADGVIAANEEVMEDAYQFLPLRWHGDLLQIPSRQVPSGIQAQVVHRQRAQHHHFERQERP